MYLQRLQRLPGPIPTPSSDGVGAMKGARSGRSGYEENNERFLKIDSDVVWVRPPDPMWPKRIFNMSWPGRLLK